MTRYPNTDLLGCRVFPIATGEDMTAGDDLRLRLAEAERENLRKSEILAHTSHEIRTQLAAVIGMTQLVRETRLTPEQAEYMEIISEAGDGLLTLVNDLLDMSKLEAGRLSIEQIPYSVRDTFSDIVAGFSTQLNDRGLWLNLDFDDDLPDRLIGDPGRLRQVIVNLINNATKFTEKGGVTVQVSIDADDLMSVAVADTGTGIPPERQAAIFESFTQADDSTARTYGGSGLGLTISKRLTEMMGGGLTLTSEVGVGSTFTATLRIVRDHNAPNGRHEIPRSELFGLPVMVVGELSEAKREALARLGFSLDFVGQDQPVERLVGAFTDGSPYALVVVSSLEDPLAVAEAMRERPESRSTHMLVLTTTGTRGDAAMCRELQIAGYLTSPYAPEDVARAAHEVLAGPAPLDLTLLVTKHWLRERRRRLNLLVVDASPTIRMSANRMLEKRGHVVVTSGSGSEALAAASARKFDAAIVDLELPGTGGVDLIRQLKAAAEYELPIVASTVSSDTEAHVAAIHAGCSFVLARPFEINDLVTAIEESVKDE